MREEYVTIIVKRKVWERVVRDTTNLTMMEYQIEPHVERQSTEEEIKEVAAK